MRNQSIYPEVNDERWISKSTLPSNNNICFVKQVNGTITKGIPVLSYSWTGHEDSSKLYNMFINIDDYRKTVILNCHVDSWFYA